MTVKDDVLHITGRQKERAADGNTSSYLQASDLCAVRIHEQKPCKVPTLGAIGSVSIGSVCNFCMIFDTSELQSGCSHGTSLF